MKARAYILTVAVLLSMCLSVGLTADTYDTHTLVAITVPKGEEELLYNCGIDIVGRKGEVFKALLTPEQLGLMTDKGFKLEVLYTEMAEDRLTWAEATATAGMAGSYYTPSKFNTSSPPAGSLMEHLLQLYNAHTSVCRLYNLGATQDGAYDIIAMKVTKNPDTVEAEPKIRIYANIHGDERGGLMVACDVLDWILANYPANATAKKLVDEAELWFIPMGNPYGNANSTRYNSRSVDLNRNFWGPAGSDQGPAWSEKETQIIRDLTEALPHKKRFNISLSFHGGEICFNSVYNYTSAATTDEPIFFSSRTGGPGGEANPSAHGLAKAYQDGCTTTGFWYTNGADWYVTKGDTNDWSYYQWSDLDTTLEATAVKTPPVSEIDTYCGQHRQAVLNYMMKTFQGVHGVMSDAETGLPLDGTVRATATASTYTAVPFVYKDVFTDAAAGDFHRVLQPGTYTIECMAPGYMTTTVAGVVVAADTKTSVNCVMSKTGLKYSTASFVDTCAGTGSGGDGVLDAGEDATLQVTLSNPGSAAATGVQAALGTSSSSVTLTQSTASFADVPGGGTGASTSPHFTFRIATGTACGTVLPFTLHMTSAQGAWDDSFTLTVGQVTPGSGTVLNETFSGGIPAGWTVVDGGSGGGAAATWTTANPGGRSGVSPISTPFAIVDSDNAGSSASQDEQLVTPVLNLSTATAATLEFDHYFYRYQSEVCDADVKSSKTGGSWVNVGRWTGTSTSNPKHETLTITSQAAGAADAQVRFRYYNGSNEWYWMVDNVKVMYTSTGSCSMNACSPLSPPGETAVGGTYAAAQKWTSVSRHEWPANPQAASYRVYRGTRDNLPNLLTDAADSCLKYESSGTSVTASEEPPGGTFYWYLVTGVNAGGEGSAGSASAGLRRVNSSTGCP